MSNKSEYKDLNKLIRSLSNNIESLENGTLSVYDLEILLDNARNIHERITVLHYLAIEKEVKGTQQEEEVKGIRFDFSPPKEEVAPNQTNLIDAIETEHHIEAVKKSIGEQKPLFDIEEKKEETQDKSLSTQRTNPNPSEKEEFAPTINDRFANRAEPTLADKLSQQPISDLAKAIGLNQRFLFMNDLFEGENEAYKQAITALNSFNSFIEADEYINNVLKPQYKWDANKPTTSEFINLVKRRFL